MSSFRLATSQLLQPFRIPCAFHFDLGGGVFNFAEVIWRQFNRNCSDVFVQAMQRPESAPTNPDRKVNRSFIPQMR